jgi:hypothetical protein
MILAAAIDASIATFNSSEKYFVSKKLTISLL